MRIRDALQVATEQLETHSVARPRLAAEALLAHLLARDRAYLYAHDERELTSEEEAALDRAVTARAQGVPLQYITGYQEFYGRSFTVGPQVLIPRPETEIIVDQVLRLGGNRRPRIIDIGTGSACIAITLRLEIPGSSVVATDIALDALKLARHNATLLGATVWLACTDVMDAIQSQFDFVVANPPYVAPDEHPRLERGVRDFEPRAALVASGERTSMYARIITSAANSLKTGGYLLMEIGRGMEAEILPLLGSPWTLNPTVQDLQGIPRTVIARKR